MRFEGIRTYLECGGCCRKTLASSSTSGEKGKSFEYAAAMCSILAMVAFLVVVVWMLLYARERLEEEEKLSRRMAEDMEFF